MVTAGLILAPVAGAVTAGPAFAASGAPTVTAVSPNSGPTSGGTQVTITGTNFQGPAWSVDTSCNPTAPNSTGASGGCVEDTTTVGPSGTLSTVYYPQLQPASAGELYVGYSATLETPQACGGNPGATCANSSYTFNVTNNTNEFIFNPATTASLQAPSDTQRPAGPAAAIAALFAATTGPIQAVGGPQDSPAYGDVSYNATQLSVSPQHVGDLMVVAAHSKDPSSSVTSVSGGGVANWSRAVQYQSPSGDTTDNELWWGVVSQTGTSTITFNWNVSSSSTTFEYVAQELTAPNVGNDVTAVTFGGTPATFVVQSPTQIQATAPGGAAGQVHVRVTNSNGTSLQGSSDLFTYQQASAPLTITTTSLPNGTTGQAYSASIHAQGGTAPLTWSISSGSLPQGLSINNSTGTISGTPVAAGTSNFTVKVTDSSSPKQQATKALSITVKQGAPSTGGLLGLLQGLLGLLGL